MANGLRGPRQQNPPRHIPRNPLAVAVKRTKKAHTVAGGLGYSLQCSKASGGRLLIARLCRQFEKRLAAPNAAII